MSLKQWLSDGKLQPHKTSKEETEGLLELVARDIKNAEVENLSPDWRFAIAYNAGLNLCTIALHISGYRTVPSKGGHHYITIAALPETMGVEQKIRSKILNSCRSKRNDSTYDAISLITEEEVDELLGEVKQFRNDMLDWLASR